MTRKYKYSLTTTRVNLAKQWPVSTAGASPKTQV